MQVILATITVELTFCIIIGLEMIAIEDKIPIIFVCIETGLVGGAEPDSV